MMRWISVKRLSGSREQSYRKSGHGITLDVRDSMFRGLLALSLLLPLAAAADWVIDTLSGCSVYVAFSSATENASWTGPCVDGKSHGVGILISSNGSRIEGEFREGRPYNAYGREPIVLLSDGRRPTANVTYSEGTSTVYGTQLKQKSAAEIAAYAKIIGDAVRNNIIYELPVEGNPAAVIDVRVDRQGKILSAKLLTSSGVVSWDEAVMKGI